MPWRSLELANIDCGAEILDASSVAVVVLISGTKAYGGLDAMVDYVRALAPLVENATFLVSDDEGIALDEFCIVDGTLEVRDIAPPTYREREEILFPSGRDGAMSGVSTQGYPSRAVRRRNGYRPRRRMRCGRWYSTPIACGTRWSGDYCFPPYLKWFCEAARAELAPLELIEHRDGLKWIDDHGWFIVVIEFEAQTYTYGRTAFISIQFLWGHRRWRSNDMTWLHGGFSGIRAESEFRVQAGTLAATVAEEVRRLRAEILTPSDAVKLCFGTTDELDTNWGAFHHAVERGLARISHI